MIERIPLALLALGLAFLPACGGRTSATSSAEAAAPIAECDNYQAALERCFHRQTAFAAQVAQMTGSAEARDRMRRVCAENLDQLTASCGLSPPGPEAARGAHR
jgi:hypothetical protein